jgi:hypothetical protein
MAATATTTQKTPEQLAAEAQQAAGTAATGQAQGAGTTPAIGTGTTAQQPPPATTPAPATSGAQTQQQSTAGNSTQGTTPPASTVGSNVPPFAAQYNYPWMQQAITSPMPGANTQVATPGAAGQSNVNWGAIPQYDAQGNILPGWTPPAGDSSAARDALNQLLSGDASGMDVSGIKNKLKEQALQMQKDQMTTSRQAAAGRGMLDSGYQSGQERRIAGATQKDILGNFRDTDIKAAEASTKNKIDASNILNQVLTGDTNRADVGFDNLLEAATQQDEQNQFGAQHGLDVANAQVDETNANTSAYTATNNAQQGAAGTNLASYQSGQDVQNANRAQDLQVAQAKTTELIARLGLAVNLEEVKRGNSQDKMRFLTDIFQTLVQNEQHNGQLGLGYAQLGMNMTEVLANAAKSIGL